MIVSVGFAIFFMCISLYRGPLAQERPPEAFQGKGEAAFAAVRTEFHPPIPRFRRAGAL